MGHTGKLKYGNYVHPISELFPLCISSYIIENDGCYELKNLP
jgi:hypothetical protein